MKIAKPSTGGQPQIGPDGQPIKAEDIVGATKNARAVVSNEASKGILDKMDKAAKRLTLALAGLEKDAEVD